MRDLSLTYIQSQDPVTASRVGVVWRPRNVEIVLMSPKNLFFSRAKEHRDCFIRPDENDERVVEEKEKCMCVKCWTRGTCAAIPTHINEKYIPLITVGMDKEKVKNAVRFTRATQLRLLKNVNKEALENQQKKLGGDIMQSSNLWNEIVGTPRLEDILAVVMFRKDTDKSVKDQDYEWLFEDACNTMIGLNPNVNCWKWNDRRRALDLVNGAEPRR